MANFSDVLPTDTFDQWRLKTNALHQDFIDGSSDLSLSNSDFTTSNGVTYIATDSITTDKIADSNVTTDKIAGGAVTTDKINFEAGFEIQSGKLSVPSGTTAFNNVEYDWPNALDGEGYLKSDSQGNLSWAPGVGLTEFEIIVDASLGDVQTFAHPLGGLPDIVSMSIRILDLNGFEQGYAQGYSVGDEILINMQSYPHRLIEIQADATSVSIRSFQREVQLLNLNNTNTSILYVEFTPNSTNHQLVVKLHKSDTIASQYFSVTGDTFIDSVAQTITYAVEGNTLDLEASITGGATIGTITPTSIEVLFDENTGNQNRDFTLSVNQVGFSDAVFNTSITQRAYLVNNLDAMSLTIDVNESDGKFGVLHAENIVVDWGDGSPEQIIDDYAFKSERNYSLTGGVNNDGVYTVHIAALNTNNISGFRFYNDATAYYQHALKRVDNWGKFKFDTFHDFMRGAFNLTHLSDDTTDINIDAVESATSAWYGCSGLTSFPEDLLNKIKTSARITDLTFTWSGCSGLGTAGADNPFINGNFTFDIPSSVTSMFYTWYGCSGLTSFPLITIPSSVTNLSRTWEGCSGLTEFPLITIPSSVTSLDYTWYGCSGLTEFPLITIPSSVTSLDYTWSGCSGLTSFPSNNIPSSVTSLDYTWSGCSGLTEFQSNNIPSSVTSLSGAWSGCSGLTSFPLITIPSSVTNLDYTWYGCSGLTEFPLITIPSSVTSLSSTWSLCTGLTSFPLITIPSSVTSLSSTWYNCSGLTEFPLITIPSSVTNMYSTWRRCTGLTSFPQTTLESIKISTSLTTLDSTWEDCSSLGTAGADNPFINGNFTFDIPSSVNNLKETWRDCTGLTSFPQIDTSNVISMSSTWYGCSGLTSFPSIDVSSAVTLDSTWTYCTGLTSFFPFLNTTHETPCSYYNTWNQCHLTFTEFDNPFTNLVSGATISLRGIGTGATTLGSSDVYETISSPSPFDITMRINEDTTYVPPFNLSTIKDHTILNWHTFITPFGSSEPQVNNYTIPEGNFNIVGWEDLELKQSPLGWTRIMRIYLPNLATADYDYVITNLVLALDNINPLEGKAELYASESTYSTAAAAAHTALLAKFDITDGGLAQ